MTMNCKGRVNVTTPGTPVPLTTDPSVTASKVFFQVIPGLTGKTYVGVPSMTKGSLAGVARILWPNSSGGFSGNSSGGRKQRLQKPRRIFTLGLALC
jgi:hypothetical protein